MTRTERVSVEEARRRGWLGGGSLRTSSERQSLEESRLRAEVKRKDALLELVRELLEAGHQVRLEHQFHPSRRWRFDVALLDVLVALEIDGGGWLGGRHHRELGRQADNEKSLEAQRLGWIVARVSWEQMPGEALEQLLELAKERT